MLVSNMVTTPSLKKMTPSESNALAEVAATRENEPGAASVHPPGYYSGTLALLREKLKAGPGGARLLRLQ
jgi:hypothetical protein